MNQVNRGSNGLRRERLWKVRQRKVESTLKVVSTFLASFLFLSQIFPNLSQHLNDIHKNNELSKL